MFEGKHLPGCFMRGRLTDDCECFCAGPERRLLLQLWLEPDEEPEALAPYTDYRIMESA